MADQVILMVTDGAMKGKEFVYEEHDRLLVGRAKECHIDLPQEDLTASRHHCVLMVKPPLARIRDMGSLHGTYVNGVKIGQREPDETPSEGAGREYAEVDLKDGDEIRVGQHLMQVRIELATTDVDRPETALEEDILDRDVEKLVEQLKVGTLNEVPKLAAYEIERELGRGAFGVVYLARHKQSGQRVALKIMRPKVVVDEYMRQLFQREIEIAKALHHPNLVGLRDEGAVGDVFYFMMEFCEGGNLSQLMRAHGGTIPLPEALPIMRQLLEGLAFIHKKGYVHRDLKPDNILLTNSAHGLVAKIGDLGFAKGFIEAGLSGLTATGLRAGTARYMAREQFLNFKYVEPVSDVWSMAATFYIMLTGHRPRVGPSGLDRYQLVLRGKIIPIRQRDPNIPPAIAEVIDRALVVDTNVRYRTAGHMLQALEAVLSFEGND